MQHLEEGTIHAWLDGQLAPNEASAIEIHVQTCEHCARAVAEARGLVAASSRILGALDDVPAVQTSAPPSITKRRRTWSWGRAGGYAAAATLLLAVGTTLVWRGMSPETAYRQATDVSTAAASPQTASVADSATPQSESVRRMQPSAAQTGNAGGAGNESVQEVRVKKSAPTDPQKEELSKDIVVPLPPGVQPRPILPAAPPPSVRLDGARTSQLADLAANAPQRAQEKLAGAVVQGRVLDASTGAPIAGAIVRIDSARQVTNTDRDGRFQLQQVPLGRQTVDVRALGYQQVQHPVTVTAKDSIQQLGFALQKSVLQLEQTVVTGVASAREAEGAAARRERPAVGARMQDSISAAVVQRADPMLIAGCYLLRVTLANERDADRKVVQSIPGRVQLGVSPFDDAGRRRALTLDGVGRAESWRLVGNALELNWRDSSGAYAARFVRSGATWSGALIADPTVGIAMENCTR